MATRAGRDVHLLRHTAQEETTALNGALEGHRMLSTVSTRRMPAAFGLVTVAVVLFAAAFLVSSSLQHISPPAAQVTTQRTDIGSGGVSATDRQIGSLQERLRQKPDDQQAATRLGLSYLQRARETS